MNELHDKSEINFLAAEILQREGLFDSVCHPAYYSCLQLMSQKLIKRGISLEQQGALSSSQYAGKSHQCLIRETRKLIKFEGPRDEQDYNNTVKQLKDFREKADYKETRIKQEESDKCISKAREVRYLLNSI